MKDDNAKSDTSCNPMPSESIGNKHFGEQFFIRILMNFWHVDMILKVENSSRYHVEIVAKKMTWKIFLIYTFHSHTERYDYDILAINP